MKKLWITGLLLSLLLAGCAASKVPPTAVPSQAPPATTVAQPELTQPEPTEHVHVYSRSTTAPTCLEEGFTDFTCTCGDTYRDEYTQALGHDEVAQVYAPTDTAPGYTAYTCLRCGESRKEQYTWLASTHMDFFDDAVFIGDSITMGLRNYNYIHDQLGEATFLCQTSYSLAHAMNNSMYLSYRGDEYKPQDAVRRCGAKKVFLLLGMNDIGIQNMEKLLDYWTILIQRIKDKSPDVTIYIQSGTPVYNGGQTKLVNNERMDAYNVLLQQYAQENGYHYIDIATVMKDAENGLAEEYTADKYVHLTHEACELWVETLKNYVGQLEELES